MLDVDVLSGAVNSIGGTKGHQTHEQSVPDEEHPHAFKQATKYWNNIPLAEINGAEKQVNSWDRKAEIMSIQIWKEIRQPYLETATAAAVTSSGSSLATAPSDSIFALCETEHPFRQTSVWKVILVGLLEISNILQGTGRLIHSHFICNLQLTRGTWIMAISTSSISHGAWDWTGYRKKRVLQSISTRHCPGSLRVFLARL